MEIPDFVCELVDKLAEQLTPPTGELIAGSPLTVRIDAPNVLPRFLEQVFREKAIRVESHGLTLTLRKNAQIVFVMKTRTLEISPPAAVTCKRFGLTITALIPSITIAENGQSATVHINNFPDLSVKLT